MTADEIRKSFLTFFEKRGHSIVPSAPVIPPDDPTLLFANAGMNQFKDIFLGKGKSDLRRVANTQKCIRVSGKHNDLEEVGRDTYHHTFFEMLGNWSFGDYYKKEAINWAWELLTRVWGLPKNRLWATVYRTDDEAEECWKKGTDIDPSHILRFDERDNFWEMGETGPCGPCSEIHFDQTDDLSGGKLINTGDSRVMEIWNLVFVQYDRDAGGTLTPLPSKHVDTGMGFERVCAILQGKESNYDTDIFRPIIESISGLAERRYSGALDSEGDIAMRVIADHVRMLTFSIADGGIPSNEGRGYVMRRILRRAARFGRNLNLHEPFIHNIVDAVVNTMARQFPEIKEKQIHIKRTIKGEEESFNATLDRGLEIFESVVRKLGGSKVFPGEDAFKLYDTYGFPLDLTQLMAKETGLAVDTRRFAELMEEQRERSRGDTLISRYGFKETREQYDETYSATEFVGYEEHEVETKLASFGDTSWGIKQVAFPEKKEVVLFKTTFYGESGGQVGDTGKIFGDKFEFDVYDTQKRNQDIVHIGKLIKSELNEFSRGDFFVKTRIDNVRRFNIERNHTATHLVHEALRRVLGTHLHQQGSLVAPDHLRFDFNHFDRISPAELKAIEDMVNEKIEEAITVSALNDPKDWVSIEEAKRRYPNIKMFFGDKYGDRVRIVEIDPKFSVELCGGTHVRSTREIGVFKIIAESGIASGIRRISAVTGDGLQQYLEQQLKRIGELDEHLAKLIEEKEKLEKDLGLHTNVVSAGSPKILKIKVSENITVEDVDKVESATKLHEEAIERVTRTTLELKKELSKVRVKRASSRIDDLVATASRLDGFKVISARVDAQTMDELKSIADGLRARLGSGVGVLASVVDNKVALVCVVTDDLIKTTNLQAGKIIGELAKGVGGSGGGREHLATAGGKDIAKLDETLQRTSSIVQTMLKN